MSTNYNTPGVYIKEVSTLPPSVAQVSSAIPAFIGYTEKSEAHRDANNRLVPDVKRINTLLEYESLFGGPSSGTFSIISHDNAVSEVKRTPNNTSKFLLYYTLALYFQNGGGTCYIVSLGNYTASFAKADFENGLRALEREDEPTLIVLADAAGLDTNDYGSLAQTALEQCAKLQNRFTILDVVGDKETLRLSIGSKYLMYGAAYAPHLQTALAYAYAEKDVLITPAPLNSDDSFGADGIKVSYSKNASSTVEVAVTTPAPATKFSISSDLVLKIAVTPEQTWEQVHKAWLEWKKSNAAKGFDIILGQEKGKEIAEKCGAYLENPGPKSDSRQKELANEALSVSHEGPAQTRPKVEVIVAPAISFEIIGGKKLQINCLNVRTGAEIATAWAAWAADRNNDTLGFHVSKNGTGSSNVAATRVAVQLNQSSSAYTLESIKSSNTALYNAIKSRLANERVTLPPSGAVAGAYVSVDRERGVWKAPANVSLSAVIAPVEKISESDQEGMNVNSPGGKSINAIRAFSGKGTLIWGARTLDGDSNEWRYVSVRRLFIMIEESTRRATAFAVFEPNDSTTWLKVKAMIEGYLHGLWQQGALAGPTPEQAYFVDVGLGKTMTAQDVLEGRMIVRIGIAAVRPAEFIILSFTHKLQQA